MDSYIARANIDHFLDTLKNGDVSSHNRSTIIKLLIQEEDKLSRDQEQFAFAQTRATMCRDRAGRQRRLRDSFNPGSADWERAERLLVNFESLAQFAEGFCRQMHRHVNESRL